MDELHEFLKKNLAETFDREGETLRCGKLVISKSDEEEVGFNISIDEYRKCPIFYFEYYENRIRFCKTLVTLHYRIFKILNEEEVTVLHIFGFDELTVSL